MYVNISKSPLAELLRAWRLGFDRSANGDFIFDVWVYRIRVNFSLKRWDMWYWDDGR